MKKNALYIALIVLFTGAAGFVVLKYRNDDKKNTAVNYNILPRKGLHEQTSEWNSTQQTFRKLQSVLAAKPGDIKSLLSLANIFILEARASGNYEYYDRAAMTCVDDVLAIESENFEALTLKSLLCLSQHHFAEGLAIAEKAQKINPYYAFLYGVLVDGHVEMGHYDSAVASAEKMMSIKPDLRSYARASYLREIHGDYPGAIEAMNMAVEAGLPGDEATEWSRCQLGHLYENTGELLAAKMHYTIALDKRPNYPHALGGLARIALSERNFSQAIEYYGRADSLVNDFSFKEELIDVYQLSGQKRKAEEISKMVIDEMNKNAENAARDERIGHYADKELAYAYLKVNNYDKALEHALAEYNRRPKNIEANETLAWVYHQKGDNAKALPYIQEALKTNSKNPVLLCRAGLIYKEAGDTVKAKEHLRTALNKNPNLPEGLKNKSLSALREI
jgi:tetratricopeptide (TPR) repeat protein